MQLLQQLLFIIKVIKFLLLKFTEVLRKDIRQCCDICWYCCTLQWTNQWNILHYCSHVQTPTAKATYSVLVTKPDLGLAVVGSTPSHDTNSTGWFLRQVTVLWRVNYIGDVTQVNLALHPFGIAKLSTSFHWGKHGKVTSAR